MPPGTRKSYTRTKTPAPTPPTPAMESFMTTQSIELEEDADEMADEAGVTYFVDEEGRYYFQPNPGDSNIVALDPEAIGQANQIQPIENLIMPDGDGNFTQTVTLVPSESTNGEVSYVLVVADENNSEMGNINLTDNEQMDVDQSLESAVAPVASRKDGHGNAKDLVDPNDEAEEHVDLAFINDTGVPGEEESGYPVAVEQYDEEKQGDADVYTFEDDAAVESNEDDPPAEKKRKRKQSRALFTCNFCAYTSHRRYLLLRHMKSHSEDRPYKCTVCERGFKTQASLQNHTNMHNGVKPHTCKFCQSTFTTSGELVRHVRYKHTHEKPHKCNECDYASVELSKLRRHVRCHTGERPYQCPHCTYASPDTFKLKRHLRTHTGEKPYKCDMCTMCFTQSNSLKAHKLIHNVAEKPVYSCELCPAKCGRKTDLRIHVQKLHTSETPLKCKRCGKSFPDRYSCKVHNKTHEGEKCYKCDLCPYASTTLRHLKSHILKHTDEKPFACDHCDQTFRQKQLLRRHQNLYHNPDYVPKPPKEKTHTCHACHRTFAHKGNLMRHLAVHDPDSGHHERALALKLGRQKKVKYIDADSLKHPFLSEIKTEGENTELLKVGVSSSLKRGELVTVSDGDGQQYVVLEVIQLDDGTEQQVAVVAPDFLQGTELEEEEEEEEETDDYGEEEALDDDEEDEEEKKLKQQLKQQQLAAERSIKLEKEVDTCFGFDVSEAEDEELEEEIGGSSSSMTTLNRLGTKEVNAMPHLLFEADDDDDEQNDEEEQEVVFELV